MPVYEGVPILAAWQAQPLAGEAVQEAVRADLICRGQMTSNLVGESPSKIGDNPEYLTEQLVRDITLRCCFVTNINRGRQISEMTESEQAGAGGDTPTTQLSHLAPLVNYPISGSLFLQVGGLNNNISKCQRLIFHLSFFISRLMGSLEREVPSCYGDWTMTASLSPACFWMPSLPRL